MTGMLSKSRPYSEEADAIPKRAVEFADALLAELDRTAPKPEPATYGGWAPCPTCGKPMVKNPPPWGFPTMAPKDNPQPDADGWIPHRPGDPMPCDGNLPILVIVGRDSDPSINPMPAKNFDWGEHDPWPVVAWKPAKP